MNKSTATKSELLNMKMISWYSFTLEHFYVHLYNFSAFMIVPFFRTRLSRRCCSRWFSLHSADAIVELPWLRFLIWPVRKNRRRRRQKERKPPKRYLRSFSRFEMIRGCWRTNCPRWRWSWTSTSMSLPNLHACLFHSWQLKTLPGTWGKLAFFFSFAKYDRHERRGSPSTIECDSSPFY